MWCSMSLCDLRVAVGGCVNVHATLVFQVSLVVMMSSSSQLDCSIALDGTLLSRVAIFSLSASSASLLATTHPWQAVGMCSTSIGGWKECMYVRACVFRLSLPSLRNLPYLCCMDTTCKNTYVRIWLDYTTHSSTPSSLSKQSWIAGGPGSPAAIHDSTDDAILLLHPVHFMAALRLALTS